MKPKTESEKAAYAAGKKDAQEQTVHQFNQNPKAFLSPYQAQTIEYYYYNSAYLEWNYKVK